MKLEV
jgi:hypothetical protein